MSISRRTDRENRLWADLPEPASLNSVIARQIVSAIVAGDPNRADDLADLLLAMERELANCEDPRLHVVVESIDKLVEMAFRESEPYKDYLEVYRMTVGERCRTRPPTHGTHASRARPLRQDAEIRKLIFMVVRLGKRWEPN
jgi:hypothetical protein